LFLDVSLVATALIAGDHLRKTIAFGIPLSEGTGWLDEVVVMLALASWTAAFALVGSHQARRLLERGAWRRLFVGNCLGLLLFIASLFFGKIYDFSRLLVAYFFATSLVALSLRSFLTGFALHRIVQPFAARVLLIGGGEVGLEVARRLESRPLGMRLLGAVTPDGPLEGVRTLGNLGEVSRLVREHDVDEIMIALPAEQHAVVEEVIQSLQSDPVRIHLVPDILELAMIRATVEDFFGIPLVGLREPPIDEVGRLVKRVFDLLAGVLLTLVAAPVLIGCAVAVKLTDGGPVFFRQRRVGENGLPFEMLKLRSMVVDAEARLQELGIDLASLDPANPVFKVRGDPRVTGVGRFLRRWSLDELPQLLNVLKGDMSLVGPRPEEEAVVAQYSAFHRKRLAVKPGITGPMQVNGRGDLPLKQRLTLELAYIESWTLWMDLKILMKTIPVVLWGKGAY
jgi:exopolysaccharide biosynthesis polyprenyl glycosylphosphotransferase